VPLNTVLLGGALLLGGLALGVFIATHGAVLAGSEPASAAQQADGQVMASTISRLETDQANLNKQIAGLQSQLADAQANDSQSKSALVSINNELSRERLTAGMTAIEGPGIVATFDDSTDTSIPEGEDPANYILHEYDLRDAVNTLWAAGAKAVSINGERIVGTTSIYCVGTTILVNSTRLSPPYEISATGDPTALTSALRTSAQMEKFNQRALIYDLPVKITQDRSVQVLAYSGSPVSRYAQVVGGK